MPQSLLQRVTPIAVGFVVAAMAAAGLLRGWVWSASLGVGFCWVYLNFYFLFRLLQTGLMPADAAAAKRILALSVLKFPVIYLTGFFILQSRFFSMAGILAGITVFFAALGIARLGMGIKVSSPNVFIGDPEVRRLDSRFSATEHRRTCPQIALWTDAPAICGGRGDDRIGRL